MPKQIPLTQGKFAIVDDDDFEVLSKYKWLCTINNGRAYSKRVVVIKNKKKNIYMHRFITKAKKGLCVDHINGSGLDNRKENLRVVTQQQNLANSKKYKNNTSGYKGVSFRKSREKYRAYIDFDGKTRWLGSYEKAEEAARIYNLFAVIVRGEFAVLNKI